MRKKFLLSIFVCAFLVSSCNKSPTTPATPQPKPRANVSVTVSLDPFLFAYEPFLGYYWSIFNVIVSEHNGVSATITTVKLEFYNGTTLVTSATYSGGTLPASGSLNVLCSPVVWYYFNSMKIIVTGTDSNGYEVYATKTYTWVTTALGHLIN